MADPWIRVHANLVGKPVVSRAAEALAVNPHEAIGLLVQFWGSVSQHVSNGRVGEFSDLQIERWAGWTRKRGKFASFIRDAHLDAEGRVNEWDDYAGKLEQRRVTERERLRNKRGHGVAQQSTNGADGVGQHDDDVAQPLTNKRNVLQPARAVRNETIRSTTKTTTSRRQKRDEDSTHAETPEFLPADEPPRITWLTPICASWESRNGAGTFGTIAGQAAKSLAPLVKHGHEPTAIAAHLDVYLERTEVQYQSITRFAQTYEQWAPQRMVDDNGILTAAGMAVMAGK